MSRMQVHLVNGNITAVIDGSLYSCDSTHKNYDKIIAAIRANDADALPELFSITRQIANYLSASGRLKVDRSRVYYRESTDDAMWWELQFGFVEHLLEMMELALPIDAFVNWIERVMRNPNPAVIEELFQFMSGGSDARRYLPILPDGRFVAYKRVRDTYFDFHSNTVQYVPLHVKYQDDSRVSDMNWLLNQPGNRIGSPRWCVDPNINNECSTGYHVGRFEYINNFHSGDPGSHVLAMRCDPSQVVAAKADGSQKKLRMHVVEVGEEISQEFVDLMLGINPPTPKLPPIPTAFNDHIPANWDNDLNESETVRDYLYR